MPSAHSSSFLGVLARLSKHLDHLSGQVFDTEEQLGELLVSVSPQKPVAMDKIQSLDFIRQSLEDCALLLHCLSDQKNDHLEPKQLLENAHQRMKLNTTQKIVVPANDDVERDAKTPGSIDLF